MTALVPPLGLLAAQIVVARRRQDPVRLTDWGEGWEWRS